MIIDLHTALEPTSLDFPLLGVKIIMFVRHTSLIPSSGKSWYTFARSVFKLPFALLKTTSTTGTLTVRECVHSVQISKLIYAFCFTN